MLRREREPDTPHTQQGMAKLVCDGEEPYIVQASTYDVVKSAVGKDFVFKIDLRWSDGSKTVCHRQYSDIFDFQCKLLDQYPEESGETKGSTRIIPFIPGKKILSFNSMRLALERVPAINEYVEKLVALPPHVSRSPEFIKFFTNNWLEDTLRQGVKEGPVAHSSEGGQKQMYLPCACVDFFFSPHVVTPPTLAPFFPISFKYVI